MENTLLTERLLAAAGDRTYRSLAELTDNNPETVRRYMQGQAPSVEFLAALCIRLGINEQWLISGRGPMKSSQVRSHALKEASASELLSAMAATLERLAERVDRLELFLSSLEVRLRGRHTASGTLTDGRLTSAGSDVPSGHAPPPARNAADMELKPQLNTRSPTLARATDTPDERPATPTLQVTRRAQRIADAIPERSHADDH